MQVVKSLSKEIIDQLVASQFAPQAPVWMAEGNPLLTLKSGQYENEAKAITPKNGGKEFTVNNLHFKVAGVKEPLTIQYRNGVKPDDEEDVAIRLFVAERDFTCTTGRIIPKGEKKFFAVMA
jgi:hypothetical protein